MTTSSEKQKTAASEQTASELPNGTAEGFENTYLKDLQKSLRNATKKLNATSKVDAIVAENPGKLLDDLVAEKKINADQKAQILKKPALQANIAQLEEQIGHYKKFATYYEERLASQKADLEKAHKAELEAIRETVVAETTRANEKLFKDQLLALSKFLSAAATMRRSGDETSIQSRAFEGVLYQVYGGTPEAVTLIQKLVDGVEEKIASVEGEILDFTYGKVKQVSEEYAPATEATWTGEAATTTEIAPTSDPTLVNAGLTELQDTAIGGNGVNAAGAAQQTEIAPPAQTLVSDAANPVAQANWDPNSTGSVDATTTENGTEVPRAPAETDTGLQATPVAVDIGLKNNPTAAQSSGAWTEDASAAPASSASKEHSSDGFEPVVHHQRQHSGRGRGRGRGRGDGFRGRGRGDFRGRGRGRGEFRGNRGRGAFGGQQGRQGHGASGAAAPATEPRW